MATQAATNAPSGLIQVEIWTDLICPWCGVGERLFAQALESFPHKDNVRIIRRSYRLMPGKTPQRIEEVLADKYEMLPQEIADSLQKMEQTALRVDLVYHMAGCLAGDTIDAHRLLHYAREKGLEHELHERLFTAAMCEQASVYDHEALCDFAVACGLERADVGAVLSGDAYREAVLNEEAAMKGHGGRSVPFFVFNGERNYAGAVDPEIYRNALEDTWDIVQNGPDDTPDTGTASGLGTDKETSPPAGAVCGPDGCVLPS
ncbi:DsbA family oxidoreductase [Desulfovibrio sp. OttesenSCG-928-G15]|nr:DsbA family oxidoreductase [Desulfovibrio sp. OttesenSCG-928-G15]